VVVVGPDMHPLGDGSLADEASEELFRGQETCVKSFFDTTTSQLLLDYTKFTRSMFFVVSLIYVIKCVSFSL